MDSNNKSSNGQYAPTRDAFQLNGQVKKDLLPQRFTKTMVATLISSGVVVIGLQSYIYYNFTQVYDNNSLPTEKYGESWAVLYTSMIMSSASANVLVGLIVACVLKAWTRHTMIVGTVFTIVAATASALAALCGVGEIIKLYNDQSIPQHVCVASASYNALNKKCITWWWMELFVVVFSGLAFIANFACFVVICVNLCAGNYRKMIQFDSLSSDTTNSPYSSGISEESEKRIPRVPISLMQLPSYENRTSYRSEEGTHYPPSAAEIRVMQRPRQLPPYGNRMSYRTEERAHYPPSIADIRVPQRPRQLPTYGNRMSYRSEERAHYPPSAAVIRVPQRPGQLQNRNSLPIVIRQNPNSSYFY